MCFFLLFFVFPSGQLAIYPSLAKNGTHTAGHGSEPCLLGWSGVCHWGRERWEVSGYEKAVEVSANVDHGGGSYPHGWEIRADLWRSLMWLDFQDFFWDCFLMCPTLMTWKFDMNFWQPDLWQKWYFCGSFAGDNTFLWFKAFFLGEKGSSSFLEGPHPKKFKNTWPTMANNFVTVLFLKRQKNRALGVLETVSGVMFLVFFLPSVPSRWLEKMIPQKILEFIHSHSENYRHQYSQSGWWFQIFFIFTPKIGEDFQFDSYFSDGLKPPTSQWFWRTFRTYSWQLVEIPYHGLGESRFTQKVRPRIGLIDLVGFGD